MNIIKAFLAAKAAIERTYRGRGIKMPDPKRTDEDGFGWIEMTVWVADGDDYRKGEHQEKFLVYGKELP